MQKLQLSIPEPCHENWQKMTPTEQGRFCNACAKEVVDFSMMTDTEVLNYFTKITHEKVCGRALPSQLERTITIPKEPKKKLFWYWNYIVMFFMFFKGNNASAQTNTKPPTELSPVKNMDIRGEVMTVGGIKRDDSRMITGKVTDMEGNPVPFASIGRKGANTGVSANAQGEYVIKVYPNTVLSIFAAGFKSIEVPVGTQKNLNTLMEKAAPVFLGDVVIISDLLHGEPDNQKLVAILEVKDEATNKFIPNASVMMNYGSSRDTFLTDKKGIHKLKGLKNYEKYFIKITADGYDPNEFTIDAKDFKDRKKEWQVLLKKKKTQPIRSTNVGKAGSQNIIRMGAVQDFVANKEPLYVVDGNIMPNGTAVNPDDIDNIKVLQGPAAAALFGIDGSNGAIVITTRKVKEIKLKEVVVNSEFGTRRMMLGGMTGAMTFTSQDSLLGETITTVKTILTDSIKVYPNPVQRSNDFSVQLKLKQPGNNYSLLITDAAGRVLLQQKFNAHAKHHTEKITGDGRWAAGIYYIRVFDTQNKLISKSSFVFQ